MTNTEAYARIAEHIEAHPLDTYSEIGRQLGLSRHQVARIAKRHGIQRRPDQRAALEAALAAIEAGSPIPECRLVGEAEMATGQAGAAADRGNADVQ